MIGPARPESGGGSWPGAVLPRPASDPMLGSDSSAPGVSSVKVDGAQATASLDRVARAAAAAADALESVSRPAARPRSLYVGMPDFPTRM